MGNRVRIASLGTNRRRRSPPLPLPNWSDLRLQRQVWNRASQLRLPVVASALADTLRFNEPPGPAFSELTFVDLQISRQRCASSNRVIRADKFGQR